MPAGCVKKNGTPLKNRMFTKSFSPGRMGWTTQGIHILSMHLPFMQRIFGTAPVGFTQWLMMLAMAVLLVMETFKWVRREA